MVPAVDGPIAKLIGSYESELHGAVMAIIRQRPPVIVNIGCAEGFYAVGLARACPRSTIHAFDVERTNRRRCAQLASLNGVANRVHVHSACTEGSLMQLPLANAAIVADCEGCEAEVFSPTAVSALDGATILIEVHEGEYTDMLPKLMGRFEATHTAEVTPSRGRDWEDYPELTELRAEERMLALDEFRPETMRWLLLRSRRSTAP